MKKYLIPEEGNFYKANLHCHTTVSDGRYTPEQVKEAYMKQGYSIVAFTDHDIFIPHPELQSDDFLPLNGFELSITEEDPNEPDKPFPLVGTSHMGLIALDPNTDMQPVYHRTKYVYGNSVKYRDAVKYDENEPDYERSYTPECISDMMARGREKGFFVTYNHPRWSMETYEQYINYENMHAMEIYNHTCYTGGFEEYNGMVYDEMLRAGKRIFCTATDDNHNVTSLDSPHCDSFGGFVMIKAPKLEYRCVTEALLKGDFYASRGPEIKSLWFDDEDRTIHVECSDAVRIVCSTGIRRQRCFYAGDFKKDTITSAEFKVTEDDNYVRITVYDEHGLTADTNAYFIDELLK